MSPTSTAAEQPCAVNDHDAGASRPSPGRRRLPRLSGAATFWIFAGVYGVFMFAAAAPTPLYGVYAARYHFSAFTLTIVFAIYAIGLLAALLVTGRLSDHLGRKPVILGAIALQIVAMLCFVLADSVALLYVGRALQGLATGAAIGAASAGLIELSGVVAAGLAPLVTSSAPIIGLAAGALGSSALVQYGPAPLQFVYWLIIATLVLGALLTVLSSDPGQRRPGALRSLRPIASIPAHARPSFVRVTPTLIALWSLTGFYLSLGPSLVARIEATDNLVWGGFAVFCLTTAAAAAVITLRQLQARNAMLLGCTALLVGAAVTVVAIATTTIGWFLVGTVIAGAGFGLAFLGSIRTVSEVLSPEERGGTLAVFYVVSYLAFSIPVVAAGIAEVHVNPHNVALVFSAGIAVLAAIGTAAGVSDRRRPRPTPQT